MNPLGIGIIGTGNISDAYLKAAPGFPVLKIIACADINSDAARAKAATYGIEALSVDALLADPRIDIVLNLTTPQHHVPVGLQAMAAGKHVYSEKPLAIRFEDGLALVEAAEHAGLRVGCAPDTFLGGSHQTARKAIDAGAVGTPLAGTAFMMVPGHELWHPNPDFYYKPGGGPMLDMGPYYLTCLVNMLGPVASVSGAAKASYPSRTIGSGQRQGESFSVDVPTHISALIDFVSGAAVTITTSFDVWKHTHSHIEIYGSSGSMLVPDPNQFQGAVQVSEKNGEWTEIEQSHRYGDGNYRILGLADMAQAIVTGRPHRANHELSLHVLEVMTAILGSAETGRRLELKHQCARPAPMRDDLAFGQLD
ncbi:MAG: Gfo/Idh/MocA family oxidoreductase [Devosia sp.]